MLFFNVLFPLIKGGEGDVLAQSGEKWSFGLNSPSGNAAFGTSNYFPIIIKTNSTEKMRITESGNVGIGTIAPADKLHVAGTARMLNAEVENQLNALNVTAQNANFAVALVTGQLTAGSLTVNGNATISGNLSALGGLTTDNITSPSGNISLGNSNLSTTGNVNSTNISSLQTTDSIFNSQFSILNFQFSSITSSQWTTLDTGTISYSGDVFVNSLNAQNFISIGAFRFSNGATPAPIRRDSIYAPNKLVIGSQEKAVELSADTVTMRERLGIGKTPLVALDVQGDIAASGKIITSRIKSPDSLIHFGNGSIVINDNSNQIYATTSPSQIMGIAIGQTSQGLGLNSVAIGNIALAEGDYAIAIGNNVRTQFGVIKSMVIGNGPPNGILENNIPNSLMIGFDSDIPTLFVGPSSGAGTVGNLGIGTSAPQYKLDIIGNLHVSNGSGDGGLVVKTDVSDPDNPDLETKVGIGTENPVRALHIYTEHIPALPPCPTCINSHNGMRLEDLSGSGQPIRTIWDITPLSGNLIFSKGDPNDAHAVDAKMMIADNGNVGIGTNNPQKRLHIWQTDINNPTCSASLRIEYDVPQVVNGCETIAHSTWDLNAQGNDVLTITNPSLPQPAMTFSGNGNVGIGTTNPQAKLEISQANPHTPALLVKKDIMDPVQQIAVLNTAFEVQNTALGNYDKTLFIVKDSGNVGIGLTTPQAKLEVQSNGQINEVIGSFNQKITGQTNPRKIFFVPHLSGAGFNNISQNDDAGIFWTDGLASAGHNNRAGLIIAPWDGGVTSGIKITYDGKVGIGTGNPQEKLDVNGNGIFSGKVYINTTPANVTNANGTHYELNVCGTIQTKEWIVETGWCDFALKPGYKKMNWRDKRNYRLLYGYLPYMDSGEEIEKNGLHSRNLKGMMWNIEEDRLDIEELFEKNEVLEKKNKELEAKVNKQGQEIQWLKQQINEMKKK